MDPTAMLQRIAESTDVEEIDELSADLADWLHSGGFPPTWHCYPRGVRRYLDRGYLTRYGSSDAL